MVDISTSLVAQLERSVDAVLDAIAKDGLKLLQVILREEFGKSEHLKNYEVFAYVSDGEISYEIVLSPGSVEETDLSESVTEIRKETMEAFDTKYEEAAVKTFGISKDNQVYRISSLRDKRKKSQDTKKSPRDARTKSRSINRGSDAREFEHKAHASSPRSLGAPRSMEVGKSGKLSINFTRKLRNTKSGVKYPGKDFEGIMKKFVEGMQDIIVDKFMPGLETIISRYFV